MIVPYLRIKDLTFSLQYGMIYYNMLLFPPCAGSSRKSRKDIIMEIERKFLVMTPPENYESFPCHEIEQAYLCIGIDFLKGHSIKLCPSFVLALEKIGRMFYNKDR